MKSECGFSFAIARQPLNFGPMNKLSGPSYNDAIPFYIFVDFYKQNLFLY